MRRLDTELVALMVNSEVSQSLQEATCGGHTPLGGFSVSGGSLVGVLTRMRRGGVVAASRSWLSRYRAALSRSSSSSPSRALADEAKVMPFARACGRDKDGKNRNRRMSFEGNSGARP